MSLKPLFRHAGDKPPPSQIALVSQLALAGLFLRDSLWISTWLLLGGLLQSALLYFIPHWWILAFSLAVLGYRFGFTMLVTLKFIPNPYLKGAVQGHTMAHLPDLDGNFSNEPSSQQVAILHLGSKFNHPLGAFEKQCAKTGEYFDGMQVELDANKKTNGYLGGMRFNAIDKEGRLETTFLSYWRSIEAIHEYAYSPKHREAWEVSSCLLFVQFACEAVITHLPLTSHSLEPISLFYRW
jgi:heme-degrading monooxygenase HmoA